MSNTANEVYQEKQTAVRDLLEQMRGLVEAHGRRQARRACDWTYVGDLGHVEMRLKELRGFLMPNGDEDRVA
jgi:hypothetical protein